mmetsp:Transcript_47540/g.54740  ORF Transcript_47540/g.54740 Transcript_47540/m.54740 type:complete len:275 (-) Transcript_47540:1153-1977(-)
MLKFGLKRPLVFRKSPIFYSPSNPPPGMGDMNMKFFAQKNQLKNQPEPKNEESPQQYQKNLRRYLIQIHKTLVINNTGSLLGATLLSTIPPIALHPVLVGLSGIVTTLCGAGLLKYTETVTQNHDGSFNDAPENRRIYGILLAGQILLLTSVVSGLRMSHLTMLMTLSTTLSSLWGMGMAKRAPEIPYWVAVASGVAFSVGGLGAGMVLLSMSFPSVMLGFSIEQLFVILSVSSLLLAVPDVSSARRLFQEGNRDYYWFVLLRQATFLRVFGPW